ncbi:hypothetical protein Pmar_PMAR010087 [Perkinsus marinus ATCC 50983]|uniref:J domain-containing protein n=1 Tax=Perkinsus marinus (strain ATCC 50983 / TXsc) TaxID=423536 RepID=C5K4T0_PERM5|nr:hypothetical protein Pmar_PMAR010087 [Perkinsus marinus ATCC 50983]EER20352.1 hypothetical protein Pmar_PMAR010087 [Perkinsus marinus ATCC 50983]|eukprot:XP_002788556.1 hypothetical protein Pmar_PMAR010087 [Perkinsus marinus ATCC 50983]
MTFVHNNYKTLNVAKEASKPAIRKAYLSLAKKYHPDVNRAPNGSYSKRYKRLIAYWLMMVSGIGDRESREHAG